MTKRLIDGTILLRSHSSSKRDKQGLRDALLRLDGITEAYITETKLRGIQYYIGGTIVTTPERIDKLRREVQSLKGKNNRVIGVDKVAMIVETE